MEFTWKTMDQLRDHPELGFGEAFLNEKHVRTCIDDFYGSFRRIHKIPDGEMLPDDLLPLFHASVNQLILKFAHPELECKVTPIEGKKFMVVYKKAGEE
jgi:hypothetical protein